MQNDYVQNQPYQEQQQNQRERKIITDEEAEEKDLKKIMVGNLPVSIKKDELRELVDSFGRVISCEVITQRRYGFVTFLDHKDAAYAKYRLKDRLFQNFKLRADWSEEQRKPKPNNRKKKVEEKEKVKRVKKAPGSLRFLTPQNPATDQQFTNGVGAYKIQQQQNQNYTPPPPQSSPLSLSQPPISQVPTHEETPVENLGGDQHQNEGGRRNNYGNRGRRSHPNRGNYYNNNNNFDNYNNNNNFVNNNFNNNPASTYGGNIAGNYEDHKPENQDDWTGQGNQRNQVYDQRPNQQRSRGSGRGGRRGRRNRGGGGGRGGGSLFVNNEHQLLSTGNEQILENNNKERSPQGRTGEAVVPNAPVAGLVPPPSGTVPHPQNTGQQQKNNYGRQKGGHNKQQYKSGKQQQLQKNVVNRGGGEVGDFVVTVANTKTEEVTFKVRLGEDQIEGLLAALQPFLPQPGVV